MRAISHIKEKSYDRALERCKEKEKEGFRQVKPLQHTDNSRKIFSHNGKEYLYRGMMGDGYYETVYIKEFD